MPHLILVRGISGSGKTTLAKELLKDGVVDCHYENDLYRINKRGVYVFDANKTLKVVSLCKQNTLQSLKKGRNVVVSNAFIRKWEMDDYLRMPYTSLSVMVCKNFYGSVHNIPKEKINWMRQSFEE